MEMLGIFLMKAALVLLIPSVAFIMIGLVIALIFRVFDVITGKTKA